MIKSNEDKTALITNDNVWITYKVLQSLVDDLAVKLKERTLIFIMADNNIESIVGYAGALRAGAVPLLLHNNLESSVFANLLSTYRPYYLLLPKTYINVPINYKLLDSLESYCLFEIKVQEEAGYKIHDEIALLLSTSGSTGSPKCVKISYQNLASNTKSIIEALNINENDRAITTLPMDYTYGLSIINTHLYQKASLVLNTTPIIYQRFWDRLKKYNCTTFGGVPYTYETLIKLKLLDKVGGLRYITQAGGKLSEGQARIVAESCEKQGCEFIIMYGQTEATARMSYLPFKDHKGRLGSIGIPIPGGTFHIQDEAGCEIKETENPGELIYEGPNVTMGYSHSFGDLCIGDERKGVLKTGDLAYRDREGFYYITGRKNRMIKVYGNRINLDEIENILNLKGYICVCVGYDDNLIVVFKEENIDWNVKKELTHMGINPNGIRIRKLREFPRNFSQKIDYKALLDSLLSTLGGL